MLKWQFTIIIETNIIKFRLGNMLKSHNLQFCIKRNIRNADEQKLIHRCLQLVFMSRSNIESSNKFIDTIDKYPIRVSVSWLVFR